MSLECLLRQFVIFHAQPNQRFALRLRNERIQVVDVQLSFQQRRKHPVQLSRVHLSHHQSAFCKRKTLLDEQFARFVRVIYDHSNDCTISSVEHHQSEHMNVFCRELPYQIMQPPQPVGCEHRELDDHIRASCP